MYNTTFVFDPSIVALTPRKFRTRSLPAGGGLTAAYLDDLDFGLLLVDRNGQVGTCTAEAYRLLRLVNGQTVLGRSAAHLLRHARLGPGEHRLALLDRLRRPLRERRPVSFDIAIQDTALSIDLRPLLDAGWSVTIKDKAREAAEPPGQDAWHDPLTGLANRPLLEHRLRETLTHLQRTGEGFALMTVDLDHFKHVNDTLGHPVGDALLCKVAERLQASLKPTDWVARLGGGEFAMLLSDIDSRPDAEILASRIVDLVGRAYVVEGHLVNIGASVGIALAPKDGADPERLLKNAGLALHRAKSDGRTTFRFFEPEMETHLEARRLLELDLRKALALRQFELVYQPQLNLESDRLIGCEALIRWRHPDRGTVSPADFIPLAEETGLIVSIGEWVVRTACNEAAGWPDALSVAVNLSPAQFKSKRLINAVRSALAASGLAPSRLELEITEGVLLQDNDANLATLHALRDLGLRISMDDFGTGYSSLSYLRAFPFDKIKIDRSFISGGAAKGDSMAIIRAIASLGASFGMTTVAEGVETHDQMRRIRAEGCTDVQGYLIGRPVAAADILQIFTDQIRLDAASPVLSGARP